MSERSQNIVIYIFMNTKTPRQKIALISVYDKTGIKEFAESLVSLGWKIISSGGTAKHLAASGIPVTDVAEITGMPPILSHWIRNCSGTFWIN